MDVIQLVTAGFVFISFLLNYENFRIHQGKGQSMGYLYEKCKGRLGIRSRKRSNSSDLSYLKNVTRFRYVVI